jgi:FlaG/FlaF family flagellin (archaellin)
MQKSESTTKISGDERPGSPVVVVIGVVAVTSMIFGFLIGLMF